MDLKQLKIELSKQIGISSQDLSNSELTELIKLLKETPKHKRKKSEIQKIVKTVTGVEKLVIKKSFDNSDIDNIIDQIEDILNK